MNLAQTARKLFSFSHVSAPVALLSGAALYALGLAVLELPSDFDLLQRVAVSSVLCGVSASAFVFAALSSAWSHASMSRTGIVALRSFSAITAAGTIIELASWNRDVGPAVRELQSLLPLGEAIALALVLAAFRRRKSGSMRIASSCAALIGACAYGLLPNWIYPFEGPVSPTTVRVFTYAAIAVLSVELSGGVRLRLHQAMSGIRYVLDKR